MSQFQSGLVREHISSLLIAHRDCYVVNSSLEFMKFTLCFASCSSCLFHGDRNEDNLCTFWPF